MSKSCLVKISIVKNLCYIYIIKSIMLICNIYIDRKLLKYINLSCDKLFQIVKVCLHGVK
jgi:hypothetical protein